MIRLNVGCGDYPLEGWVNVDVRALPGVDVVSRAEALPFADSSVTEIYAGHVLEHLEYPLSALCHWHALLRPGGALWVTVPDFEYVATHYHCWTDRVISVYQAMFGLDDVPEQRHRHAFSPYMLCLLLTLAGFQELERVDDCPYWVADVPWQMCIRAVKPAEQPAGAQHG